MEEGRDWEWYLSPALGPVRRIWENYENGSLPLSELDDDEISRIQLRDNNGQFRGRKPFVTQKQAADFRRELMRRVDDKAQMAAMRMWDVIAEVAESTSATGSEKMRAAQYLLERSVGKIPDKLEVTAEVKPWEGTVMGILQDITDEVEVEDVRRIEQ